MGTRIEQKKRFMASFFIDSDHDFNYHYLEIGEQKLVTAMIERAFLDFYSNDGRYSGSARIWVFEEKDTEERIPFSFNWCCGVLGWDASELREKFAKRIALKHKGLYTLKSVKLGTVASEAGPTIQAETENTH